MSGRARFCNFPTIYVYRGWRRGGKLRKRARPLRATSGKATLQVPQGAQKFEVSLQTTDLSCVYFFDLTINTLVSIYSRAIEEKPRLSISMKVYPELSLKTKT